MATYEGMRREIIELHEKLDYNESTAIRPRILDAINRGILNLWSKCEWTFRVRELETTYNPEELDNPLPDDFLTFHHTGRVVVLNNGVVKANLAYMPFNEMMRCLRASIVDSGTPEYYSIGGPISGEGNQRSLFLYPKPVGIQDIRLIYQATAPQGTEAHITREIPYIPGNWHYVIKEIAILNRLIDKSADTSVQTALVKTCIDSMMRDEPHGKEDMPKMQPAYAWRMRMR